MADIAHLLAFSQRHARQGKKPIPSPRTLPRTAKGLDRLLGQAPNSYLARYVENLRTLYGDAAVRKMMSNALTGAAKMRRAKAPR
jgi:hypothetical protein